MIASHNSHCQIRVLLEQLLHVGRLKSEHYRTVIALLTITDRSFHISVAFMYVFRHKLRHTICSVTRAS